MKKKLNYAKVEKGNILFLVPTHRDAGFGMNNEILWSLKEFNFKVFGYLDAVIVISHIMKYRAISGRPFYDIDMNMYDPETYPDTLEESLKNTWSYVAMRQTYRYFDQLISTPAEHYFAVSIGWNNTTRNALQIYSLNSEYQKSDKEFVIQFSSYIAISEMFIEELVVKIGKCEKMEKNYEEVTPVKKENFTINTEHLIKNHNNFFLLKNGKVYCGLTTINPNVLHAVYWRTFVDSMIHSTDNHQGYKMKIYLSESVMEFFSRDYIHVDRKLWSIPTQFTNIIDSEWKRITQENPDVERVVVETRWDEDKKEYYAVLHYLNKDWQGPTKEIRYKHNEDHLLENIQEIAKSV